MERLKRRTDFRAAAQGARAPAKSFVLQALRRDDEGPVRVGFTVSRQVGNAVERNRVRRRLREMIRLTSNVGDVERCETKKLRAGHDYVLIGRRAALGLAFSDMVRDLEAALRRVHGSSAGSRPGQAAAARTGAGNERSLHRAGSPSRPFRPRRSQEQPAKPHNETRREPSQKD